MKVVYDHQIFGWQEYGGISRYIFELALEMATANAQDVSIVSPFYVNQYLKHAPKSLKVLGIPIGYIPRIGRIVRAVNSIFVWPVIRHLQPDIVHETYYSTRAIAPKSAKVVLTVHDMIHEKFSDEFSAADPTRHEKALAVQRADHIICISQQTKNDLIELLGVNPLKTSVVHHGFNMTQVRRCMKKPNLTRRPFLLFVGKRGAHKNFQGLLHAYAASRQLKSNFDLISFGGGAFNAHEMKLLQQLRLDKERIHQISGDDFALSQYYRAASAFVYPSKYEGFGIPPLEAMSFNCPVVCSGVSSIPEVVGDAASLFDPGDPNSIRMAIERVVSDDVYRNVLINRGVERIKFFSWQRCAQETLEVYRQVLLQH